MILPQSRSVQSVGGAGGDRGEGGVATPLRTPCAVYSTSPLDCDACVDRAGVAIPAEREAGAAERVALIPAARNLIVARPVHLRPRVLPIVIAAVAGSQDLQVGWRRWRPRRWQRRGWWRWLGRRRQWGGRWFRRGGWWLRWLGRQSPAQLPPGVCLHLIRRPGHRPSRDLHPLRTGRAAEALAVYRQMVVLAVPGLDVERGYFDRSRRHAADDTHLVRAIVDRRIA
eukprot:3005278-Prymnesium_polylepis.2